MNTGLWIFIGVVVVLALWVVAIYNSLIRKRNHVRNAWSDIDVQLKRRFDLVPNLVETVKGYKNYEAAVLENVTRARTEVMNSRQGGMAGRAKAENMFSESLKTLFAVAENYPDLKASTNFQQLQGELANLENDIQSARQFYNAAVRELNTAIQVFPTNLLASALGFEQSEFFGAEKEEWAPVKISF